MTYIVAVSGGVDSVVLLDMVAKNKKKPIIVAHFDHGIRGNSQEDARFVENLAKHYGLPFYGAREELGTNAGEALARERRYVFLRDLAVKHNATIMTAHHADDLVETVAINLVRGTGWRGLAVLDSDIERPLLHLHKDDIIQYAQDRGLEWREDSTNASDAYLRNRIRPHVAEMSTRDKQKVRELRHRQAALRGDIENEVRIVVGEGPLYSRYIMTHVPKPVALECLRVITNGKLTRPQLERLLLAIKTILPGGAYHAGAGITTRFTTRYFTL